MSWRSQGVPKGVASSWPFRLLEIYPRRVLYYIRTVLRCRRSRPQPAKGDYLLSVSITHHARAILCDKPTQDRLSDEPAETYLSFASLVTCLSECTAIHGNPRQSTAFALNVRHEFKSTVLHLAFCSIRVRKYERVFFVSFCSPLCRNSLSLRTFSCF